MRVKTPQVGNGKNGRLSGQKMHLVSSNTAEKPNRPITAVGGMKQDNNDLAPKKGRRVLGSAKPANRRKLRGKKVLNAFDKNLQDDYSSYPANMNGFGENQLRDVSNKFQTNEHFEESNFHKHEFSDRPPSRQKEPSLALGIGSEYGEDIGIDDPGNQITSEIILTTGIPAPMNEFSSKYTPCQARRGVGIDLRGQNERPITSKAAGADAARVSEKGRKSFPMKDRRANEKKTKDVDLAKE